MTKTESFRPQLSPLMVEDLVRTALLEDLGRAGDITTYATIGPEKTARMTINGRDPGVVAGLVLAETAFRLIDPSVRFEALVADGDRVSPGQPLARVEGSARAVLSAERVALNFLMHLSGVASYTARFSDTIAHTKARVTCTRKTLPGLRAVEKYAVRLGGGSNHRYGLDDAILIKDNHIAICGGVAEAIHAARAYAGHLVKIEVEVDSLHQMREALDAGPDVILLDNMTQDTLFEAVEMNRQHHAMAPEIYASGRNRTILEASGNVTLQTVRTIAETGVDFISTSKITMAAPTMDIGLDSVLV